MAPSACSRLSLSSGFKMCEIAIEDDKKRSREMEVNHDDLNETDEMKLMKVDREVMDGEFAVKTFYLSFLR
jgi:hypothetical protein